MRQIQSNRKRPRPDKISIIPFIWKVERERNIVFPKSNQSGGKESPKHKICWLFSFIGISISQQEKNIFILVQMLLFQNVCYFILYLQLTKLSVSQFSILAAGINLHHPLLHLNFLIYTYLTELPIRLVLLILRRLSTAPLAV